MSTSLVIAPSTTAVLFCCARVGLSMDIHGFMPNGKSGKRFMLHEVLINNLGRIMTKGLVFLHFDDSVDLSRSSNSFSMIIRLHYKAT